eukprot:486843_1
MRDFVSYLCEVEPHFDEKKLKMMLRNEDMSQSEVSSLWRQVTALNEPDPIEKGDDAKVYYDYVFAFNIGDEPDWMPEVRDYAAFTKGDAEEEKEEFDVNERIEDIMSGEDGNETLNSECKDLVATFEDAEVIRRLLKHILVSWRFKKMGDIDDPDNVGVLRDMFGFEERVFHLHLVFKKYRREHIRKLLLDLAHERDEDKKLALETDLKQVLPEWDAYFELYKQYKTQAEEREQRIKEERRKERDDKLIGIPEEKDVVCDATKKIVGIKKKKARKLSHQGLGGRPSANRQKSFGADVSVSRTNVLDGIGNDALQDARDSVRELRDRIKPFLSAIRDDDTWTTYAEQAAELIERLHGVGLDLRVWKSERNKIIFCLVGLPHKTMLFWADQRDVDIEIDAARAITYGQDDLVQCKLAQVTASVEEEAVVQAALEEER